MHVLIPRGVQTMHSPGGDHPLPLEEEEDDDDDEEERLEGREGGKSRQRGDLFVFFSSSLQVCGRTGAGARARKRSLNGRGSHG